MFGNVWVIVQAMLENVINSIKRAIGLVFPGFLPQKHKGHLNYITLEEVIEFNKLVTGEGGLLRDRAGLERAIMRPQTAAYYEDADIARQASLLIEGVAAIHAFIDGNKRTALLTGLTFLEVNGYKVRDAHNVIGKRIEELVIGHDIELFTTWLRSRIQSL